MEINLIKFGKELNTRELAEEIFLDVPEKIEVIVNFNGIDSTTPSFCHAMIAGLFEKKCSVSIRNANSEIIMQINKSLSAI